MLAIALAAADSTVFGSLSSIALCEVWEALVILNNIKKLIHLSALAFR
jgi:hypothetical protein